LIVDDCCSRGGTFVHSSKLLKRSEPAKFLPGAKKVFLMVAYCENTIFEGELFDHIDMMYISLDNNMKKTNRKLQLI
jgi:phosphoribosylpyrophosphate synthetase